MTSKSIIDSTSKQECTTSARQIKLLKLQNPTKFSRNKRPGSKFIQKRPLFLRIFEDHKSFYSSFIQKTKRKASTVSSRIWFDAFGPLVLKVTNSNKLYTCYCSVLLLVLFLYYSFQFSQQASIPPYPGKACR